MKNWNLLATSPAFWVLLACVVLWFNPDVAAVYLCTAAILAKLEERA